jgi:hypothetical protein
MGIWRKSSKHSNLRYSVEVSNHYHVPATLSPVKELIDTGQKTGWAPEPVSMLWRKKKPCACQPICRTSRNLGTKLTELLLFTVLLFPVSTFISHFYRSKLCRLSLWKPVLYVNSLKSRILDSVEYDTNHSSNRCIVCNALSVQHN